MAAPARPKIASSLPTSSEPLRRLETLRPRLEVLTAERIRAESEVERLARDEAAARATAREIFGTDDPDAIGVMIEADRQRDHVAMENLEALLADIEARLAAAGGE